MGVLNIRNFPDDLKKELKKLCIDKGSSMREEVIRIISKEVKKERRK